MHLTTAEIVSIIIAVIGSIGVVATSIIGKHNSPKASEIEEEAPLSAELIEALQKLKEATTPIDPMTAMMIETISAVVKCKVASHLSMYHRLHPYLV